MKIRITRAPHVGTEHGITDGRVFEVIGEKREAPIGSGEQGRFIGYWVQGDAGERVAILRGEYEELAIGEKAMSETATATARKKRTRTKKPAAKKPTAKKKAPRKPATDRTRSAEAVKQLIEKGAKVLRLSPDKIKDGWRARKDYGAIDELAEDIRENGQMQPILIRRAPKYDGYLVIAGARRLRACRKLKTLIRAIVVKPEDELHALTMQLAENIMRKNFEALEVGEGLKRHKPLYEKAHPETKVGATGGRGGKSKRDFVKSTKSKAQIRYTLAVAQQMGVSESKVQKLLQLSDLPTEEKEEIAKQPTPRARNKAAADKLSQQRKRKKEEKLAAEAKERQAERRAAKKKTTKTRGTKARAEATPSGQVFAGKWEDHIEAIREAGPYDLILTDPPYGEDRSLISHERRSSITQDISSWDQLDVGWVNHLAPTLAKSGQMLIFCPLEAIGDYQAVFEMAGLRYRGALVWHKTNPGTAHRPVYLSSCEALVWATNGTRYHFPTWKNAGKPEVHNFREGPLCGGKERVDHPTQKPLWLIEDLLVRHTAKGDAVLDPFMGVATTLVAAARHGRISVGVEMSKKFLRLAKMRLQALR
jgi:site-specific DNA-methyltransferase (adenine-specific)/modification methylase